MQIFATSVLASFFTGVFFADVFREYWVLNLVFAFFLFAFLFRNISWKLWFTSGLFFLFGCARLFLALPESPTALSPLAEKEEKITIEGFVDSYPLQSPEKTQFYFQAKTLIHKQKTQEISERVLVNIYGINSFSYLEKLSVTGKIVLPKDSEKFSYSRYLERDGVYVYFPFSTALKIEEYSFENSKWEIFQKNLFTVRIWFENQVRNILPMPESEYALGITLGAEKGIPQDIIEDFNDSGLRHLLALSGFNITILLVIIFWTFSFLSIRLRIILSLLLIFLFVVLTGSSSSVVRAAIMGGIGMVILHMGRQKNIPFLVLLTLAIIAFINPFLPLSDPSLQLSILAVLGMYFFIPLLEKNIPLPKSFPPVLKDALWATLGAQIGTLPLVLYFFGNFSVISPVANICVAPLTSLAMLFTALSSIPYLGFLFMPFAYGILHLSLSLAAFFAALPFAKVTFENFPWWGSVGIGFGIVLLLLLVERRTAILKK